MVDIKSLDPETQSFALVGQFLKRWSEMEVKLHETIGAVLNLDETKRYILCANLRLQDKINILRTLVDVSTLAPPEKDQFKKQLTEISDYSHIRNMMAHVSFKPHNNGDGVVFSAVKAKATFSVPDIIWSIEKFQNEGKRIEQFTANLCQLRERITGVTFSLGNLDWMTIGVSQPSAGTVSQDLLGHLFLPFLVDPDSSRNPST
jgi:hypothetical protein